jgi:hypothetical protein
LYFDEKELWSPSLNDMIEDFALTETVSVNQAQKLQGRKIQLVIAPFDYPHERHTITIGEE